MKKHLEAAIIIVGDGYQALARKSCSLAEWMQLKFSCSTEKAAQYAEWYEKQQKKQQ